MSQTRELCRGADRNKKTAHRAIFLFGASNRDSPNRGNVTGDKRVTARYEQLEPVTLNMLSATAVASLYRYDKTIHRIVLSATDNSRVPLLQYGVAGERSVQRCRQKQKRPLYERSFCLAPQTEIPLTGEMSRSDKRVTARYEQLEPVGDVVVQK